MKDSTIWYILALIAAEVFAIFMALIIIEPAIIILIGIPAFGAGYGIYVALRMHYGLLEEGR